jgi:hypothetical protein
VVRNVECLRGEVTVHFELGPRFAHFETTYRLRPLSVAVSAEAVVEH